MTRFLGHGWVHSTEYVPPDAIRLDEVGSWTPAYYIPGLQNMPKATIAFVWAAQELIDASIDYRVAVIDLNRIDEDVAQRCIDTVLAAAEKMSELKAGLTAVTILWKSYTSAVTKNLSALRRLVARAPEQE